MQEALEPRVLADASRTTYLSTAGAMPTIITRVPRHPRDHVVLRERHVIRLVLHFYEQTADERDCTDALELFPSPLSHWEPREDCSWGQTSE
jgi:hypothetical protein